MSNTKNTTPGWRIHEAVCSWLLIDSWLGDVKIKVARVQHVWLHEIRGTFFDSSSPLSLFFFYFTRDTDPGEVGAKKFFPAFSSNSLQKLSSLIVIIASDCIIAHHTPNPTTPGEGNDCTSLFNAHEDRSRCSSSLIDWRIV